MSDTAKGNIAKGAALLGISAIIVKIIGVIYKVPLSYILSDEGMGYFNSAYTVYTFFFILSSAGVPKAISIITSKSEAECKINSHAILVILSKFFLAVGILICILFYILSPFISKLISNQGALSSMYAVAPSIPLLCLGGVMRGYLVGKMDFLPVALSEIISGASKLVFGLLLAVYSSKKGMALSTVSAYTIFGITLGSFLCLIPLFLSVKGLKGRYDPISSKKTVKEALKIATPITISSSISGIAGVIDLTLIMRGLTSSGYSETAATVIYGNYTTLAVPMFALVATLISQISMSLLPAIISCNKQSNEGEKEKCISFAMFLSFFIAFPCAIFYFTFPSDILGILFEKSSVALGAAFLSSVAPSVILIAPLTIINTVLEAEGEITLPVASLSVGSLIKLLTSAYLIGNSEIGVLAASVGTLFSYAVPLIISGLYLRLKFPFRIPILKCIFIPLIAASLSALCGLFIKSVLHNVGEGRIISFIFIIAVGAIYLILSAILSKNQLKIMHKYVKMNKSRG